MPQKPPFDDLPLRKDGPPGNAWGLFGPSDECGMLNLLTPEKTQAAAAEIKTGIRISTDWPLDAMARPCFGRAPFKQTIKNKAPREVNDDTLEFNTQSSSQWDGFRHYAYQDSRVYFNGRSLGDVLEGTVNGIHGATHIHIFSSYTCTDRKQHGLTTEASLAAASSSTTPPGPTRKTSPSTTSPQPPLQ